MCRMSVKIIENSLDSNERKWSFIDKDEFDYDVYLYELDRIFVAAFAKLINRRS
jgi:hypothetical protein